MKDKRITLVENSRVISEGRGLVTINWNDFRKIAKKNLGINGVNISLGNNIIMLQKNKVFH